MSPQLATPKGLQQLQTAKAERNLSFAAIAKQAGVSAATVSRLFHPERGKGVSASSLQKIAAVLALDGDVIAQATDTAAAAAFVRAEELIREALEEDYTYLTLSNLGLTAVPAAIGQLQNLTALDLSHNQLSAVPPEWGQPAIVNSKFDTPAD